jgi:hypothetical protein
VVVNRSTESGIPHRSDDGRGESCCASLAEPSDFSDSKASQKSCIGDTYGSSDLVLLVLSALALPTFGLDSSANEGWCNDEEDDDENGAKLEYPRQHEANSGT